MTDEKIKETQGKNGKVAAYTEWIIHNRIKVIFGSLLIVAACVAGARHLEFKNNYRVFFGKDNPQLKAFEEVENSYTKSDNVYFVLAPKSKQVFTAETLSAVEDFTKRAWQLKYSTRVNSITNFQHTRAEGDDLHVADLVKDAKNKTRSEIEEIRQITLKEPAILNSLITPKADVTGVNVEIQLPGKHMKEVVEVADHARLMRDQFKKEYPNIDVYLSGVVMLNNAFPEASFKDMQLLTPLMYLSMILIMMILLRSFWGTIASIGVILFSSLSAMGIAGHLGIKLTAPSSIAPTIILTLAIADAVHILVSMFYLMRRGASKDEALIESMRINIQPVFLTSLTTVIGFLCLNFSDAPPYHDLGNITAIGVALAFGFSVLFLPAAVAILPIKVKTQSYSRSGNALDSFADFVIRKSRILLFATSALALFLLAFIPKLELNDQFVQWFDDRIEFRRDTDFMTANLTGIYGIVYSIQSGEEEGVSRPDFLRKINSFAEWWREQPETVQVSTYADTMKRINKSMHGDDPDWYRLPDDFELASQYLLLYEMSLPFGLDLNNELDIGKSAVKVVVTLKNLTSTEIQEVASRGDQWLKDNAPPSMHANGTGPAVMFSHMSERNVQSMVKGTTIALILITILMMIALKSFKFGLISILPNALPALMAFGIWSISFTQVGMAISIVASATLGIIVDDSIHFLTKYLRARREEGKDAEGAIRYAFSTVGVALIVTSSILIVGFAILSYSPFLLNWSLGALSAFTIAIALFMDFVFLPTFLLLVEKKKQTTRVLNEAYS